MTSKRSQVIEPFLAVEIFERAQELERQGKDIIHLEFGEPDFDTPPIVREAAEKALKDGRTRYAHSLGLLPLREAIAEHYHTRYGVTVSPEQILVTAGTSPAMLLLFSTLLDSGDEVLLTDPRYAVYPNLIRRMASSAGRTSLPGGSPRGARRSSSTRPPIRRAR